MQLKLKINIQDIFYHIWIKGQDQEDVAADLFAIKRRKKLRVQTKIQKNIDLLENSFYTLNIPL